MDDRQRKQHPNQRHFLVALSMEAADGLEDLKYHLQRRERRRVTKRELVETAVLNLIAQAGR